MAVRRTGSKDDSINFRIEKDLKNQLKERANAIHPGMKLSDYVRLLVLKDLDKI